MNREEFLGQLENLLQDISEEERVEALTFYRSYFEDAGENKEEDIIKELESPEKVAESIKADLAGEGGTTGSAWNSGAAYEKNTSNSNAYNQNYGYGANQQFSQQEYAQNVNQTIQNLSGNEKKEKNTTAIVLGIIVAVITSPIWLSILAVVASLVLAVLACVFSVVVAVVAVIGACIITGFVIFGVGVGMLFSGSPAVGIALIGAALLVIALGILAILLLVWLCGVALPWICKGIVHLCKMPFQKKRKESVAA